MRLVRLDLLAWGHFDGLSLDLSAKKLHLVYGPNEAGKSTTRRAVHALLFGVPRGADDAHALGKATMLRVGGRLEDDHGLVLDFVRKGGVKDTLLSPSGGPISGDALVRLRGKVGGEAFTNVFSMDHTSLKEGAEAILESGGELSESLAVAALGSARLAEAKAKLVEREDELYNPAPNARKSALHTALQGLKDAKLALQAKESSPEAFKVQEAALEGARSAHRSLVVQMAELRGRREQLDEATVARDVVLERARLATRLRELADVPVLPAGLELELTRATSEQKNATTRLRVADEERREVEERALGREAFTLPAACVARLPDIERGLRHWEAREPRRRELERQIEACARQVERLRATLPGDAASWATSTDLRVLLGGRAAWQRLAEETRDHGARLEETKRRGEELERELAETPPSRTDEITRALAPLDGLFALDDTASSAQRAVADATRDEAARAAKVVTSSRASFVGEPPLEALVESPLPSRERLTEIVERAGSLREKLDRTSTDETAARERLATVRERLAVEALTTRAVTEEDLGHARSTRDALVVKVANHPDTLDSAREAVRHADALADRMRREMDRVLRHVELVQEEKTLAERVRALAGMHDTLGAELRETGRTELALAQALGGRVTDVAGLPSFRAKMDALIDALRAHHEARLVLSRAVDTELALASAYAKGLEGGPGPGMATLAELRACVTERRERLRADLALARAREDMREKLVADLRANAVRQKREQTAFDHAREGWTRARASLGLDARATPNDVRERFDLLSEIVRVEDAAADMDLELRSIAKEDALLASEVAATARLVAEHHGALEAAQDGATLVSRAEGLVARLERARLAENEAKADAEALDKIIRGAEAEARAAKEADARKAALFATTGATDEASFLEIVRRAEERDTAERSLRAKDEELGRLARKTSLTALETLVATHTPAELEAELAELDTDLARLDSEAKRALESVGSHDAGLAQFR